MTKVVITMPAYHAADTLERTVADIPVGIADELILVDDASGDETVAVARKLNITVYVHDENRGYGGNQKTCYRRALEHGADIVVMLHPDYQYDPTAVPLLIAPLLAGRADMTFGSRFAGLSDPRGGGMPLYRYLGNRTATTRAPPRSYTANGCAAAESPPSDPRRPSRARFRSDGDRSRLRARSR